MLSPTNLLHNSSKFLTTHHCEICRIIYNILKFIKKSFETYKHWDDEGNLPELCGAHGGSVHLSWLLWPLHPPVCQTKDSHPTTLEIGVGASMIAPPQLVPCLAPKRSPMILPSWPSQEGWWDFCGNSDTCGPYKSSWLARMSSKRYCSPRVGLISLPPCSELFYNIHIQRRKEWTSWLSAAVVHNSDVNPSTCRNAIKTRIREH